MYLRCWLLAALLIVNEVAGLPAPKLEQRSLDEAATTTWKQKSNLLGRFFSATLAPRTVAQEKSTSDTDTTNHAQNALEYQITYPELHRRSVPVNSASREHAARSTWWSQTLQKTAVLKRDTNCGADSQCGNGNNNNGSNNGVNNGGGNSTTDKNIALGVGLGIGIPSAIAAVLAIIDSLTTKKCIKCVRRRVKKRTEGEKKVLNGVNGNGSLPPRNVGAQYQVPQPHRLPELENGQGARGQGQRLAELGAFRN